PAQLGARRVHVDERGRITNDGERIFTWNDADQLVKVVGAAGATVESVYGDEDVRRMRIERRADGSRTTMHFIDAWAEASGGELTRYIVHAGQRIVRLGNKSTTANGTHPWARAMERPSDGAP